jgi:hypothetical protein
VDPNFSLEERNFTPFHSPLLAGVVLAGRGQEANYCLSTFKSPFFAFLVTLELDPGKVSHLPAGRTLDFIIRYWESDPEKSW